MVFIINVHTWILCKRVSRTSIEEEFLSGYGGVEAGHRLEPLTEMTCLQNHCLSRGAGKWVLNVDLTRLDQQGNNFIYCMCEG